MKRCPACGRDYNDDSLSYCLDDGSELLFGPVSMDEPATAILRSEAPTTVDIALASSPVTASVSSNRKFITVGTLAILAAVVVGVAGYWFYGRQAGEEIRSIAVLPFENKGSDPDSEYLSDGLAESLIYRLSQLPDLKVSPTSSVLRYKGAGMDPLKIGSELGVGSVMTGRIVHRGDNLTISVELVDVGNGKVLWGEQFDRKASELLATQREIAKEIVENLKLKVSPQEKALTKQYTQSNDAYNFYLKGRFFWNKRTAENVKKAIEQFQQAADKDPSFALAYVGLADCYLILEQYGSTPSSETLPKARAAAVRALEIDDSLAEAHTSLGMVNQQQWKPVESEKEYRRAIELNPNYATTHHWYSILLTLIGRPDEAMAEIQRAQQIDPLSPIIALNIGNQHALRGELEDAAKQYQKALELNPNFPSAISDLGYIFAKQGREQEAIAYLQKAAEVTERANEELASLGYGYGILGKRTEAMAVVKELEARHAKRECPAMYVAAVYLAMRDKDQAFAWLEKDFQARTALLPYIALLPVFDTLRSDPRYTELMRRTGFR